MPGRGGAGNYQNAKQELDRAAQDIEASRTAQHLAMTSDQQSAGTDQRYAHSGRGGAGNYYSPQELNSTGTFASNDVKATNEPVTGSSASTSTPSSALIEPARKVGRGGAGNMVFGVTLDEERAIRRSHDEKQKQDKVKADVEASVHAAIPEPPKAKLPGSQYE